MLQKKLIQVMLFVNFFITISVDKRKVQNILYIKTQEGIYMQCSYFDCERVEKVRSLERAICNKYTNKYRYLYQTQETSEMLLSIFLVHFLMILDNGCNYLFLVVYRELKLLIIEGALHQVKCIITIIIRILIV